MKKQFIRSLVILAILSSTFYVSCKKKKTNEKLYEESKASDLTFYKGKDTIYGAKGGSPHGNFKLKFNAAAIASFGNDGKLPAGGSFKDGALIVKEVYSGSEPAISFAIKRHH
jgi:hypothetical protein